MHIAARCNDTMLVDSVAIFPSVLARLLKLAAILRDEGLHGPRRCFTEGANCLAVDVIGDVPQQIDILRPAMTVFDAVEHFLHPQRAFAARRALAAGLVRVEL